MRRTMWSGCRVTPVSPTGCFRRRSGSMRAGQGRRRRFRSGKQLVRTRLTTTAVTLTATAKRASTGRRRWWLVACRRTPGDCTRCTATSGSGWRTFGTVTILPRPRLRDRCRAGTMSDAEAACRVRSWIAHAEHADTWRLRHALFRGGAFDPARDAIFRDGPCGPKREPGRPLSASAWSAAAPGTTIRGTAAPPTATGTNPTIATTISGSAWPARPLSPEPECSRTLREST